MDVFFVPFYKLQQLSCTNFKVVCAPNKVGTAISDLPFGLQTGKKIDKRHNNNDDCIGHTKHKSTNNTKTNTHTLPGTLRWGVCLNHNARKSPTRATKVVVVLLYFSYNAVSFRAIRCEPTREAEAFSR